MALSLQAVSATAVSVRPPSAAQSLRSVEPSAGGIEAGGPDDGRESAFNVGPAAL